MLKFHVFGSGSKGNAALIENAETGVCVGVDCGLCARDYLKGFDASGADLSRLCAILITHEHVDHTKGLGVVLRALKKRGATVPVYVEEAAGRNSADIAKIVGDFPLRRLECHKPHSFEGLEVTAFRTSHDAASSCGFRFEAGGDALGYITDSGFITPQAHEGLQEVRILALESNHDPHMLKHGPYPTYVKARIASERGHLSNQQAAEELSSLLWPGLEHIVAMHISENNNTYNLPVSHLQEVVGEDGPFVQAAFQRHSIHVV